MRTRSALCGHGCFATILRVRTENHYTVGFCRNKMDCQHNFLLCLSKPTKLPEGIVYLGTDY